MTDLTEREIRRRAVEILESFNDVEMLADVMKVLFEVLSEVHELGIDNLQYKNNIEAVKLFRLWADVVADKIMDHEFGETRKYWVDDTGENRD